MLSCDFGRFPSWNLGFPEFGRFPSWVCLVWSGVQKSCLEVWKSRFGVEKVRSGQDSQKWRQGRKSVEKVKKVSKKCVFLCFFGAFFLGKMSSPGSEWKKSRKFGVFFGKKVKIWCFFWSLSPRPDEKCENPWNLVIFSPKTRLWKTEFPKIEKKWSSGCLLANPP